VGLNLGSFNKWQDVAITWLKTFGKVLYQLGAFSSIANLTQTCQNKLTRVKGKLEKA